MTALGVYQILFFFLVILALAKPMGDVHGARLRRRAHVPPSGPAVARGPDLQAVAASGRTSSSTGRTTRRAAGFSFAKFLFVYLLQRLQGWLPLNPQGFSTAHAPADATP